MTGVWACSSSASLAPSLGVELNDASAVAPLRQDPGRPTSTTDSGPAGASTTTTWPDGSAPAPSVNGDVSPHHDLLPETEPADGRCGLTPKMIVSASTLPKSSGTQAVDVGFGWLFATGPNLYYSTYTVETSRSGQFTGGTLSQVPIGGGPPTELASDYLFQRPLLTATDLIFAASGVPSNQGDVIMSLPLSGGAMTTRIMLNDDIVNGFATDGEYIYFSEGSGIKAISVAPDAGSSDVISLVPGLSANVIFPFEHELIFAYPQGQVASIPLPPHANSPIKMLGTCPVGPTDIMRCGPNACWLAVGSTIEQIKPDASPTALVTLTGSFSDALGVAFDETDAYVRAKDFQNGVEVVERVPLDGSAPVVLVRMPASRTEAIAVDDACVYWATADGIFSLTKTSHGIFQQ